MYSAQWMSKVKDLPRLLHHTVLLTFLWWFCRGCSPLPIPNREVKPLMADGTAPQCGRVGSCHIHLKSLSVFAERLFCSISFIILTICQKIRSGDGSQVIMEKQQYNRCVAREKEEFIILLTLEKSH